jgi:hypothetical protein
MIVCDFGGILCNRISISYVYLVTGGNDIPVYRWRFDPCRAHAGAYLRKSGTIRDWPFLCVDSDHGLGIAASMQPAHLH